MKIILQFFIVCGAYLSFPVLSLSDDTDVSGFGEIRVENEYKLSVPAEIVPQAWEFIKTQYHQAGLLQQIDSKLTSSVSIEYFTDVYYDNNELYLLNNESGIRHRTRYIPDNPDHPKNGRSLVQLKLKRPGDQEINRSEIKFPVITEMRDLDMAPPIGLIKKAEREAFYKQVSTLNINPLDLKEVIKLQQERKRVYISRENKPFATITFDSVSSKKWWKNCEFVEIEMELNEINYTEGTADQKQYMESINQKLKQALLTKFPQIKQDQTPKYNKIYNCFDHSLPLFTFVTKYL